MSPSSKVMQSYGRCCASSRFFDDFYAHFLFSSPAVLEHFRHTNIVSQKHLLRAGILNLVLYARGMPDTKLRALGESHSRTGLNIKPELYDLWLDSLLRAVKEHDHEAKEDDLTAWRDVLGRGINLIKSFY